LNRIFEWIFALQFLPVVTKLVIKRFIPCILLFATGTQAIADPHQICTRIATDVEQAPGALKLMAAVSSGNTQRATQLLQEGANPNARDATRRSALSMAAMRANNQGMLNILWDAGASPFLLDRWGRNTEKFSHVSNKGWLQQKFASLGTPTYQTLENWRKLALDRNRDALCAQYDHFRRFSVGPDRPSRVLHYALSGVKPVDPALVRLLAETGEFFEEQDAFGAIPISIAAVLTDTRLLDVLLWSGADANAANRFGATPLIVASNRGNQAAVVRLLEAGADTTLGDANGNTPLLQAVRHRKANIVSTLLAHGVASSQSNRRGESPIGVAVANKDTALTKQLLEHNADPNGKDAQQRPALIVAAQTGQLEIAALLLDHDAKANLAGPDGRTALDILRGQDQNRSEFRPVLDDALSELDDSPIEFELAAVDNALIDPVYPSDLDADSHGGYLPAIDSQINELKHNAYRHVDKIVRKLSHTTAATPELDRAIHQQRHAIDAEERAIRDAISRRAALKADRAALAHRIIQIRAAAAAAQQRRAAEAEQTVRAMESVAAHANNIRIAREELRLLEKEIKQFDKDYSQLEGERFDEMRDLRALSAELNEELALELESSADQRAELQQRSHADLSAVQQSLAEEQNHASRLNNELRNFRQNTRSAQQEFEQKKRELENHLTQCNTTENRGNDCHKPGCKFVKNRNSSRELVALYQSRQREVMAAIQAHRPILAEARQFAQNETRVLQRQHKQAMDNILIREQRIKESFSNRLTRLELRVAKLEAGYAVTREAMLLDYENAAAHLKSSYGADHQQVYAALAKLKAGLSKQPLRDAEAIAGWRDIVDIAKSYRDLGIRAQGLESLESQISGLNLAWKAFARGFWLEMDYIGQAKKLENQRQVMATQSDSLENRITEFEDRLHSSRIDLALLEQERRNAGDHQSKSAQLTAILRERVDLLAEFAREAFIPAAARELAGEDTARRDAELNTKAQKLTGQLIDNPLLEAIKHLPTPTAGGQITLTDYPNLSPIRFEKLNDDQSRQLATSWLNHIDFDAREWRSAIGNSARAMQGRIFYGAVTRFSNFDRAQFMQGQLYTYRFLTAFGAYWIQADGSLLSFLERDLDPMFAYQFLTPADTLRGKALREAYARYVNQAAAAFPNLPDANKDWLVTVEAAFRTLDDRRFHHVSYQVLDQLIIAGDIAISAVPTVGHYYTLIKVIYGQAVDPVLEQIPENIFDLATLWPYGKFFRRPYWPSLREYSTEAAKEVAEEITKTLLFKRDELAVKLNRAGHHIGLGKLDKTLRRVQQLRKTLAATEWQAGNSPIAGPTPHSLWSTHSKPVIINTTGIELTLIAASPRGIYLDTPLTRQRRSELENCLGISLRPTPPTHVVRGPITFGVARNPQNGQGCIVFTQDGEAGQ